MDAAVKVVALANVLMNADLKLSDVRRKVSSGITAEHLRQARSERRSLEVGMQRDGVTPDGGVEAAVQPERLKLGDPLAQVHGTSSIISFETDVLPHLIITEQDPTLETTAYGLLADFLTAVRSS